MPAPLKTEAIVLRSIRYGEADRILHLYTPHHGRIWRDRQGGAAGAQPVRGPARAVLPRAHRCCTRAAATCYTVTGVDTVAAHSALRDHAATLDGAARACDAVARLFETADPHPEVFVLLANELALLCADPARARPARRAGVSPEAAARGRNPAAARGVRRLRRDRAPAGLLGRRRRGRVRLLRGGRVPARRGRLRVPGRRSAGRWRRRRRRPSALCARPSERSPRPPSTTRTCGCARCSTAASRQLSRTVSTTAHAVRSRRGAVRIGV